MFQVSVIICSHNPREDYLRRVLTALKAQTLLPNDWELLLIDNASKDPIEKRFDISWHPNARFVREEKLGLTHARLRGIAECNGELLVFVDDDNVLRNDYLQACMKIGSEYPWLGAWGGSCIPEFEIEPPAELRPWLAGLLIEKLTTSVWAKLPTCGAALPFGAGMVVRRSVAMHYREEVLRDPIRQALGRTGKKLAAGEDSDMALCGFALNLGTGRFPELELTHLISAGRLTLRYIEGLHEGFGYSGVVLRAIHDKSWKVNQGTIQPGTLKMLLLRMAMLAQGKSHVERQIRLAEERGQMAAMQELARLGYFDRPSNNS